MNKHYKKYSKITYILLILFFIYLAFRVVVGLYFVNKDKKTEGYSNNMFLGSLNPGKYPKSEQDPLLKGIYPLTGSKTVSNKNYNDIWWEYPIFKEGSYKQITNNLRYYDNPDEGTCIRAEFCNAIYDNKKVKSDYVLPLPPVRASTNTTDSRVNYYWSHPNILLQPEPDFSLQPNYL